ncbi:uncharacterized protein [Equus caballus]|uniref:uncharacterized protein isoform X3 n=1 Tax=Equus caballus TaxID=9796 RepID=UPI0038B2A2F4
MAGPEWGVGRSRCHRPPLHPDFLQSRFPQCVRPWHLASRLQRTGPHDGACGVGEPQGLPPAVVPKVLLPPPAPDPPLPMVQHLCGGPVAMPVLGCHAGHCPDVPSVQDSASLLYGRDRRPRGCRTRRRLPGASLRAAAHQGQVGERGRALPRGPVPVPACKQPFRPWLCQKLVFHTFSAARTQVHGRSCRAAESGGARLGAHADPALLDGPLHTQSPSRSWARIWTPGTTSGSLHTGTGSPRQRRSRSCTPPEENPTGRTAASPFLVLRPLSHPDSTAVSRPSTFCHLSVEAGALVLVGSSSLKGREFTVPSHPAVTFMLSWLLGTRFFPSQLPNLVN